MAKLSIITITYNSVQTLENTIQSVLQQNFEKPEYIIIDGGSSDGTLDIIEKYKNHLTYWISEKDNGISDAFNKGLKSCNGDIIGIINSDDIYRDNIFQKVFGCFEKSDADFVFGNMQLVDQAGKYLRTIRPNIRTGFPYGGMPFGHPTLFVKKSVYDRIGGFNLNYRIAMDFELYTRIRFLKGYYLDENIVAYSRGGMSDRFFSRGHREVLAATLATEEASFPKAFGAYFYSMNRTLLRKLGQRILGREL